MNDAIFKLAQRFESLHETLVKLEDDLAQVLEQESRALAELEQGARFDAGRAERQGQAVKLLEQSLERLESSDDAYGELVDLYRELLEAP